MTHRLTDAVIRSDSDDEEEVKEKPEEEVSIEDKQEATANEARYESGRRKQKKYKKGAIRADGCVYFVCRACELEKEIGNTNQCNADLKPTLWDKQMLTKHYGKIRGKCTKLALVDLEAAKVENIRRLKEAQQNRLSDKSEICENAPKRKDKRTGVDRRCVCKWCGMLKSHTALMKMHFNKSCKNPCPVLKERNKLVDTHAEELARYRRCEPLKKAPQIQIFIQGPLDMARQPNFENAISEEFRKYQVEANTIVTSVEMAQLVQTYTSGPAGNHRIGREVYLKLKQGLPLTIEDTHIIRTS